MNNGCINFGIEIPNDSKDNRIKRVIEDITVKDSYKMSIISTFFEEKHNTNFRTFLLNNLSESEKIKHNINSIEDLNNSIISKINMNSLKSTIKKYYNLEVRDIDNYNSKENNKELDGFQSFQAKYSAKVHTASKVIEAYYAKNKNTEKLYETVTLSIRKEFINDLVEPLIINLSESDKNEGIKEKFINEAKNIKEIYNKINSLDKEIKQYYNFIVKNNKTKDEEIKKQVIDYKNKIENIQNEKKILAKERFILISNLIKDLPASYNKYKNYLALYNQIINNKSEWFKQTFRLRTLLPLKNIDVLLSEEEKVFDQYIDSEDSFNNYGNDNSIDEFAKNWSDKLLASYEQNISNDVKLYLSSFFKLDAPVTNIDKLSYSYDPDLGVKTRMSSEYVIQQIYEKVQFHSIDEMINSLDIASQNIKDLYGLGVLVYNLKNNNLLANRIFHELAQNRTSKIQINIAGEDIRVRNSNEASKGKSKFIFDAVNSTISTLKNSYTKEKHSLIYQLGNTANKTFNNKKLKEQAINDFIEVFTSFVPNIKRTDIENYFYRSNLTLEQYQNMFKYLNLYLDKIATIKNQYEEIYEEYDEKHSEYKKQLKDLQLDAFYGFGEEQKVPEKPKPDYSKLNYNGLYDSSIVQLTDELFKTMSVDVQLNSLNAENNTSTDLLPNSKLTDLIKQLTYQEIDADGNITDTGLIHLRDFVDSCDINYKYSNIFYGSGKTKGLFTKNLFGGPSRINKEAKDIIRLSLFDGISDRNNNKGVMYNKMTKGDYFVTQLETYFNYINFYDNSQFDKNKIVNKAGYFMRTPSDAPKNFVIQTIKHDISTLIKNNKIDTNSDFFKAFKNIIYGELNAMFEGIKQLTIDKEITNEFGDIEYISVINNFPESDYFENYHYKGNVVKNINGHLRLTGNVFEFMKLFNTNNFDINEKLISDISLYGVDNTSILIEKDGYLQVNSELLDTISINLENYDNIINDAVTEWINNYLIEIENRSKKYEHLIPENITKTQINEAMLNYVLAYNMFDDIFEGDVKFYKDAQTFLKRAKEAQAGGKVYSSSVGNVISGTLIENNPIFSQDFIENNSILFNKENDEDNRYLLDKNLKFSNGWRAITIYNTLKPSKEAENIKKELYDIFIKEGLSKKEATEKSEKIAKGYIDNTKVNDAQSYITIDEFIKRKYADGTLEEYLPILEKIYSLKPDSNGNYDSTTIDLTGIKARIQVQKNFYYDINRDNDTRLAHPRQIKNAEFVLIPQLLPANSDLRRLYDVMKKHNIGQINTAETSKAAKKNILTLWDNNGNWNENFEKDLNEKVINNYYYRYLYKQQDVAQHMIDEQNKAGIQVMKKILDNAVMTNTYIRENVNNFIEAYSANIKSDFYSFIDRMGWEYDQDSDSIINKGEKNLAKRNPINFDKFYELGRLEAQRLGLDSNFIDYLTPLENGKPIMPNYMSNVSTKLESIAQSMFNNNITRQKLPGWHAAQITNVGYSKKLKYHPEEYFKIGTTTNPITKEEYNKLSEEEKEKYYKASYAEVLIPRWNNLIPKDYPIEKLVEEGLDLQIGYRIPTEGKQSISILKVVGFIDEIYGSTIMVPDEWVTQTGSDFDVDSIYGIYNPIYSTKDENGNLLIKKVEPNLKEDEENIKLRYNIYIKNILKEQYKNDYELLKSTPKDNYNNVLYNIISEHNLLSYLEFKEFSIIEQQTKEQRNAIIVQSMINILNHPTSKEENYSRSNFDDIISSMKKYNIIREKANDLNNSTRSAYNPFDQIDFMENAMNGAVLKAFSVTRDTFNSLCNKAHARLRNDHSIIVRYNKNLYNKETLIKRYGEENIKENENYIMVRHNMFGWSNDNKNIDGNILTVYSSQTTAHILDAIKEGAIYNENTYTFGTFKTLIDLGLNYDTAIAFLIQPAITEINNEFYKTNSVYINSYANPINNAIKNLANRLGLKYKNNGKLVPIDEYTSLDKVKKLLITFKDENGITLKDRIESIYNIEIKNIFDENNYNIDLEILENRLKHKTNSNNLDNIAIDLVNILLFNKIRNTTLNIEKLARCSNPDKFGAKQTIHETRNIINNIFKFSNYKNSVGNTILVNNKTFLNSLYSEDSFYPQLYSFYKYSTQASTKINNLLFVLESEKFNDCFDSIVNSLGRNLTVEEYKQYKQYIITAVYNMAELLAKPLTINSQGYIVQDFLRTNQYEELDNGYDISLKEKYRIFGYNITEDGFFELNDFNNPSEEEINRFNNLSPAQKVLWIQKAFKDNSGIFKQLNVTIFNQYEYDKKGRSTNRISYIDNGKNIDDLIYQFDAAFNNKHPFVKLTAIDLIKYAFYVDGFSFKYGGISKIISNSSLLNLGIEQSKNIIDELNNIINSTNAEELSIIAEKFIRSHSELVPNIELKGTTTNSLHKAFLSGLLYGELYRFNLTEGSNNSNEFLNYITKDGTINPNYIRITKKINKNKITTLYKIIYEKNDVYLYPLNLLETNEYTNISSNINNNKYREPSYYQHLIKLNKSHNLSLREVAKVESKNLSPEEIKEKEEIKNEINKLKEKYKIPNVKFNILLSTLNSPNKLLDLLESNDNFIKNEIKQFIDRINKGITRSKGSVTLIEYPGYKIKELFNIHEDVNDFGFIQYVLDENGEKYPIRITKTKLSLNGYKALKDDSKINITSLPIEEQEVIADIRKNLNSKTNIYEIQKVNNEELSKLLESSKKITKNEIEGDLFSITSDIEYTDIYEYPKLTQITKEVIDNILYNRRLNVVEERDLFNKRINSLDLNVNSLNSIYDNTREIFKAVNEYYKTFTKKILNNVKEFKASNGKTYDIGSKDLYEYLIENNEDYQNIIEILLEAKTLGDNLKDLFELQIDSEDKLLLSYIEEIRDNINKLKSNTSIKEGFNNIFDIYFAKKYSNNPNIKEGIVKMTEVFGDANKADLLFADVGELNHKQIQVVAKMVYSLLYEAKTIKAPKLVNAFTKEYDKIMKEAGSINFDKIIDKDGRFIKEYTQKFIEDRSKFSKKLEELREDPEIGPTHIKYLRKELEYEKWKLDNLEQPLVAEYYQQRIAILENLYNNAGELYSEYLKIKQEQNDPAAVLLDPEEELKRQRKYKNKIKALLSGIDEVGNIKSDKKLKAIESLKNYFDANKSLQNKYFINKISEDFKKLSKKHLEFIESYKIKHPNLTLEERLQNEDYREAHDWLLSNGTFKFTSNASEIINNAFSVLKNNNNTRHGKLQRLLNKSDRTDAFGIIDGRKFTEEEINEIRKLAYEGFNNQNNDLLDATLIKDIPIDDNIYNKHYYNLFNSNLTDEEKEERKKVYYRINELIGKGVNEKNHIDSKLLFEKCTIEELEELASLYRKLRKYESGLTKEDLDFITSNVEFKTNEASFYEQYTYFQTNIKNNPKLKQLWREIFLEHEFDELGMYVVKLDREYSSVLANRFIYGYIEPKSFRMNDYIDKEKTEAKNFINNDLLFEPTEYYYIAMNEAINNNNYKEWFDKNHIYNPYSRKWEPLSIWTTMSINPNSELAKEYIFTPNFDEIDVAIKEKYKNKEYNKKPKNYKKGNYDNNIILNNKERNMLNLLQKTMKQYVVNGKNKVFVDEGFAPAQYKIIADRDFYINQALGVFGLDFRLKNTGEYFDKFDYRNDEEIDFPMLDFLKGKGFKEKPKIPHKHKYESTKDYNERIAPILKEREEIEKENLKIHSSLLERDWRTVFRNFIHNATITEEKNNLKNTIYLLLESLKSNEAYEISNFGKVKTTKHGTNETVAYDKISQDNYYKITHNWARRILFNQFKEKHPLTNTARLLQNITTTKYMALNLMGGIANINTGLVNIMGENFAKDYFGNKEFLNAQKKYKALKFLSDMYSETSNDFYVAASKFFDIVNFDDMLERQSSGTLAEKIVRSRNLIYGFQSGGEHYMQNSVLFAMMESVRLSKDENGKTVLRTYSEYINDIESNIIYSIIGDNESLLKAFKYFKSEIKQDANKKKKYERFNDNLYVDFAKQYFNEKQLDKFIKIKKELLKNAKIEFEKLDTVESQLELKNGKIEIKKDSEFDKLFGEFKIKVISVNKKIHGVYDKYGAARIERKWYGSLIMQYHKHIYPGLLKRWRGLVGSGYYNEMRGSVEYGSYISLGKFLATEFKNINFKNDKGEIEVLKGFQNTYKALIDTFLNVSFNWNILPEWEKANIRRTLGDLAGVLSAMLIGIALYALTDDDDEIKDSIFLSEVVYLADRLNTESSMWTPLGLTTEFKTQWSNPLAARSLFDDLFSAAGDIWKWITDDEFDINYKSGRYHGQNRIAVKLKRNIPFYRQYDKFKNITSNNQYYRIGDNNWNLKFARKMADFINPNSEQEE